LKIPVICNLTTEEHAPEVFIKNHHGEVDIWSVGKLIEHASKLIIGDLSEGITEFGRLLQNHNSDERPSAMEALENFAE
jgi:hypothetical protein